MRAETKTLVAVAVAALLAVAILALSSRYEVIADSTNRIVRLDRWTGQSWVLLHSGKDFRWTEVDEP